MAVIRGLEKEELNRIFDFYPLVFKKTPLKYFTSRLLADPYLKGGDIRIAEESGEILSSVTVYRRQMHWEGKIVQFGGIGNVSTHPDHRGKGLSSKLIEDAINYMKKLGFPISILFTGINSFYEKFGYFTVPAFKAKIKIEGKREYSWEVREFEEEDLLRISQIYLSFNQELKGAIFRDEKYWRANLSFAEEGEVFLVAEKQGEIQAYLRAVPGHEKGDLWEWGFYEIEGFLEILKELAQRTGKSEFSTAALLKRDFFQGLPLQVEYEPSTLAMGLIMDETKFKKEDFLGYTFWWTDNF